MHHRWGCHLLHDLAVCCRQQTAISVHCQTIADATIMLHLQVGDKLYVQLPGAAGMIASPVVAIENVIEHSAFNLQTLRGGKDSYQYRL